MFNKGRSSIIPFRFSSVFLIALAACLLMGLSVRAQDEKASREIEAVVKKIHALMREAEELQEVGDLAAADALRQKAEKLEIKLRAFHEKQERSRPEGPEKLERILDGLERGMVALDELGRREELEMLRRVADGVRERMKHGERGERERAGEKEREVARHQIEVMNLAMHALKEAEKEDAADILKRAIQAHTVRLKGLKGEEAEWVLEHEPKLVAQVEMLALASRLWKEFGHERKAATVGELAERLGARLKRDQTRGEKAGIAKTEQIEAKIAEIKAVIEALEAELRAMDRRKR